MSLWRTAEYYVRWLFDHPERANGMDLEVAIEHLSMRILLRHLRRLPDILPNILTRIWTHTGRVRSRGRGFARWI